MSLDKNAGDLLRKINELKFEKMDFDKMSAKEIDMACLEMVKNQHYRHILCLMMAREDGNDAEMVADLTRIVAGNMRNKEARKKAIEDINIIGVHSAEWNIAQYHYEKANKNLCMMMITLMDYIVQIIGGESVIYRGLDKTKYVTLLDEITALNAEYQAEYYAICAFDFCTKKLGEYMKIPEYADVAREHNRVIKNGNPDRVSKMIQRLKDVCDGEIADSVDEIQKLYVPEPVYLEDQFEMCYKEVVAIYDTEEIAICNFSRVVASVSERYKEMISE